MFDCTILKQFQLGGKSFSHSETLSKGGLEAIEEPIPIAWASTLSTRTDNNTGILTMDDAEHVIATSDKVDLYWTNDDGTLGTRRGMTVGTVSGVTVPIDLGAGDNLPAADTVINAAVVQVFTVSIAGDDVTALLATADFAECLIVLMSTGDTVEELVMHIKAGQAYDWLSTTDVTNPIAGDDIDAVHITVNDTVTVRNARVAAQLNT